MTVTAVLIKFNFSTKLTDSSDLLKPKKSVRLNSLVSYDRNNSFHFKNISLFNLNLNVDVIEVKDNK